MASFPVDMTHLTGAMAFGLQIGALLDGVLAVQIYNHFINYPDDRMLLKAYVAFNGFLQLLVHIFNLIAGWMALGPGFGTFYAIELHWPSVPPSILGGLVTALVHAFYSYRIYRLTQRALIPILILTLTSVQLALNVRIAYGIAIHINREVTGSITGQRDYIGIALICILVADIMMTFTLAYTIRKASEGLPASETVLTARRIVNLAIQTGALTTIVATIHLVLNYVASNTLWNMTIFLIEIKLYSITMMATLAARPLSNIGHQRALDWYRGGSRELWEGRDAATHADVEFASRSVVSGSHTRAGDQEEYGSSALETRKTVSSTAAENDSFTEYSGVKLRTV